MRWMLAGPWPVGPTLIPGGTVIDSEGNGVTLPMPPPINAVALDEEAALAMAMAYDETNTIGGWHQLHFAPGIDRAKVLAQARHKKRWPNGEPIPSTKGV
jgi:hypothetical protein